MNAHKGRYNSKLPLKFILPSLFLGIVALSLTAKDNPEFDPDLPAVVTDVQLQPVTKTGIYENAQFIEKTIPAHLDLEQCDDTEPPICATETVELSVFLPDFVATIAVGDILVLSNISE